MDSDSSEYVSERSDSQDPEYEDEATELDVMVDGCCCLGGAGTSMSWITSCWR